MNVGVVVSRNMWRNPEDIFDKAVEGDVDARNFIEWMCSLRQGRRPLTAGELLQKYEGVVYSDVDHPRVRHHQLYGCLKSFFGAYLTLRNASAPRLQRPAYYDTLPMSRKTRRAMSSIGVVNGNQPSTAAKAEQA